VSEAHEAAGFASSNSTVLVEQDILRFTFVVNCN